MRPVDVSVRCSVYYLSVFYFVSIVIVLVVIILFVCRSRCVREVMKPVREV